MEDNFFEMPIDMNKSLAEIMDSTDKSRIFLTSDWHVMKYKYQKGRNYVNTNEIVKWCKDNIKSNDIFIYLGDLCYRYANKEDSKKAQEIYKSLPGIKVLILGNHDIHQGEDFYNNCGFDYVFTEFEYHDIVFTHRPINMIMRGNLSGLNIHGHIHELTNDYDFLDPSRNINVYPNNYGNKPTTLKYILNHINKLTKDNRPNNTTDLSDGLTESSRIIRDYLGSQLDDSNIINENYIKDKDISYSNSFNDVQEIINSLSKDELNRVCNGTFKNSPYVIYREVLLVSGEPVSFIDVYKLPKMKEDGVIVIATKKKWRSIGLASKLVKRMKSKNKGKNFIWKTQEDNESSIALAKKNNYNPFIESYIKEDFMQEGLINSREDISTPFFEKNYTSANLDKFDPNGSNILYVTEGKLLNKAREVISTYNWKKKAKRNNFKALTEARTEYNRHVNTSASQLDKFYKNNDFFIECVSGSDELCQILANMLSSSFEIKEPVDIYIVSGDVMNKKYDLYGDNAYQKDVHHVIIPLDTLKNVHKDCVLAKTRLKARWFNDVVDNNEYREYLAGRHKYSNQIKWLVDIHCKNESALLEANKTNCKIYSCFAGVGKNYAIEQLRLQGYRVDSIEKERDFYKIYPKTEIDFPNDIIRRSRKNDILFIPYFLGMYERFLKNADIDYTIIYPDRKLKSYYIKRFAQLGFTREQIKYLSDNFDKMIDDIESTPCNKIKLDTIDDYCLDRINESDGLTESSRIIRDYLGSQLDDSNIMNEGLDTFLTTNPFKDSVTLYHGSSYQQKQTVIKPEGICAGNRFSSPHMASFWAPTFEYAELFGLFRVIGKELDYYCGFAGDAKHIFVLPQEYSEIERKIKNKVIWVYVKNISKKYITAGHVRYIDEFTIPVDVKPDEAICLKWNDFKELFYDTVIKLPYKDKKDNREFLDKEYKKMQKLDYVPSNLLKLFIHYNMEKTLDKVRDYKKLN